ncbi:MAG: hypothetical protein QM765_28495 [Myxococcales bacterium]
MFACALLVAVLGAGPGAAEAADLPRAGRMELPSLHFGESLALAALLAADEPGPVGAAGLNTSSEAPRESGLVQAHRVLKPLTAGALLLTVSMGTLLAINYPTAFGDGKCAGPHPIFGTYGCDALNIDHGVGAVLSTVLYTATSVLELTPEVQAVRTKHLATQRWLGYVHLAGFILMPIMGIVSAYPQIIGIAPVSREQFSKVLRTVHLGVGYVTLAAYGASTILEF